MLSNSHVSTFFFFFFFFNMFPLYRGYIENTPLPPRRMTTPLPPPPPPTWSPLANDHDDGGLQSPCRLPPPPQAPPPIFSLLAPPPLPPPPVPAWVMLRSPLAGDLDAAPPPHCCHPATAPLKFDTPTKENPKSQIYQIRALMNPKTRGSH